ncbi:hypothetical protein OG21DRAFT_1478847 [Imleria badia]|nr:hypothetical protein OG21DRAFT_1478847 [Imleria badia]
MSIRPVQLALAKVGTSISFCNIRKLAYKIINSMTKLLPQWGHILDELNLPITNLPKAVDGITQDRECGLRLCELDNDEWEMLDELRDILKILKDATKYFSRVTPNLATVIPVMDAMDTKLRQHARNDQLSHPICAGITITLRTLNHYYSLTDSSEVYRIAMSK